LWWLIEGKRPPTMYGSLTENEVAELHGWMREQGYLNG
jgi:hypothetical protein